MGVSYIAPVRATAERYYKLRNLAADEVDCRGKNLPIFLNSLPQGLFEDFQKWLLENLGFQVFTLVSECHVSLKTQKQGQAKAINLSDAGFGYSQILPIVTQLWYIAAKRLCGVRNRNGKKSMSGFVKSAIQASRLSIHAADVKNHPDFSDKLVILQGKNRKEKNICQFVFQVILFLCWTG